MKQKIHRYRSTERYNEPNGYKENTQHDLEAKSQKP